MGRRKGVVLTDGLGGPNDAENTTALPEEEKEIDYNDRVFGKVRGLYTVPILRGQFEILDILGFDVSFALSASESASCSFQIATYAGAS